MRYDIAIVGGGPAGLSAAYCASKEGANVIVFERDPSFGHNVRTSGVTWIKDMERFNIPGKYYNPIKNFKFISPNNQANIFGSNYSACVLDIKKVYQYLATNAAEAGSTLYVKSNVFDINRDSNNLLNKLSVSTPAGKMIIEATLVIDASGFNSYVSRKLHYVSGWTRYGAGAEYECYCDNVDPETLYLMVGRMYSEAGYAWVFPLSKNRVRIGVGIGRPESNIDPLTKLNKLLKDRSSPLNEIGKIQPIEFHSGLIPNEGLREKSIFDGMILVGDTAGQANPLVLEGIRYAIEFGQLAGRVGAYSLQHNSLIESLRQYEIETTKILHKRISSALKVQSRWMGLTDSEWDKELDIIKDLTMEEFLDFIKSEFSPAKMAKLALNHPKLIARQLFNMVLDNKKKKFFK